MIKQPGLLFDTTSDFAISQMTDSYFWRTRSIVEHCGDVNVTYVMFLRRPVLYAPQIMIDWLTQVAQRRGSTFYIASPFNEGDRVGGGEPLLSITGSLAVLVELETLCLQKLGAPCVAAYNAEIMATFMPKTAFIAMDARHTTGVEMMQMMGYAAGVGSRSAQKRAGAIGFIGSSTNIASYYFSKDEGIGTIPHALVGYAGSTLRAIEIFVEIYPSAPIVILNDYFGREITDTLEVCNRFKDRVEKGEVSVRLDTHGGRYFEGLDIQTSYEVLERYAFDAVRIYRSEKELSWLVGTGVSAAAVFRMREVLNEAGFHKVKIVVSSGFDTDKCRVMASVNAPIDIVGTGSYLPDIWRETYATADIIRYGERISVKVGREFLLKALSPDWAVPVKIE